MKEIFGLKQISWGPGFEEQLQVRELKSTTQARPRVRNNCEELAKDKPKDPGGRRLGLGSEVHGGGSPPSEAKS